MSTPQNSPAPAPISPSDPAYVADKTNSVRFSERVWEWLRGLSPSGATEYETGPVAITVASGYSGSPTARRVGKAIYLRGPVAPSSGNFTSGVAATIATLPAEFRPASGIIGALGFGGTIHGAYSINASTGAITVRPDGTGTSVDLSGCTPYLVD